MTNAELLAKIKAEIERRWKDYRNSVTPDQPKYRTHYFVGKGEVCEELLSSLSTLESEKPINPDDAMKELDEKIALVKQRGTWDGVDVDKYMDEVRGREPDNPMNLEEEINLAWEKLEKDYSPSALDKTIIIVSGLVGEKQFSNIARHFAEWGAEHLKK